MHEHGVVPVQLPKFWSRQARPEQQGVVGEQVWAAPAQDEFRQVPPMQAAPSQQSLPVVHTPPTGWQLRLLQLSPPSAPGRPGFWLQHWLENWQLWPEPMQHGAWPV